MQVSRVDALNRAVQKTAEGQLRHVKSQLPGEVQALWPGAS